MTAEGISVMTSKPTRRRRLLALAGTGAVLAATTAALAPTTAYASSHREAPLISGDPRADNTDTYAFVSPDKPDTVTLIANWYPFEEPNGGPNFYPFAEHARYNINIDNNGDGVADIAYRWIFHNHVRDAAGQFLYNTGVVNHLTDPTLNFYQTYNLQVTQHGKTTTLLRNKIVAPSDTGAKSMPDYGTLRAEAIPQATWSGGTNYVGQSDDPFFLDLRVFDLLYGADLSEAGYDTLSGYNVNTAVLQVPKAAVVAAGDAAKNPVIGVWSTTSRMKTRVLKDTNAAPTTSGTVSSDAADSSGNLVQVSRLGNPLVNEAVVPAQLKDYFNRSTPDKDAQFLAKVQNPEVPQLVEGIYGV